MGLGLELQENLSNCARLDHRQQSSVYRKFSSKPPEASIAKHILGWGLIREKGLLEGGGLFSSRFLLFIRGFSVCLKLQILDKKPIAVEATSAHWVLYERLGVNFAIITLEWGLTQGLEVIHVLHVCSFMRKS